MVFWRNSRRGGHRPLHEARGLIVRPVLMLPVESERRSKAHRLTDAARARWYALTAASVGDARGAGAAAAAVGSAVPQPPPSSSSTAAAVNAVFAPARQLLRLDVRACAPCGERGARGAPGVAAGAAAPSASPMSPSSSSLMANCFEAAAIAAWRAVLAGLARAASSL